MFFFECGIVEGDICCFFIKSFGQIFQDFRVIQYSVHVATPACVIQIITVCPSVVEDGYRTFGNVAKQSCPPHVYLVALTGTVLA